MAALDFKEGVRWIPTKNQWEFEDGSAVTAEVLASGKLDVADFTAPLYGGRKSGKTFMSRLAHTFKPDPSPYPLFTDWRNDFRVEQRLAFSNPSTTTVMSMPKLTGDPAAPPEPFYHDDPEAEVKFSEHSPVSFSRMFGTEEHTCSPFQRDSYSAVVEFLDDGAVVSVALPAGARKRAQKDWVAEVVEYANALLCLGELAGEMP